MFRSQTQAQSLTELFHRSKSLPKMSDLPSRAEYPVCSQRTMYIYELAYIQGIHRCYSRACFRCCEYLDSRVIMNDIRLENPISVRHSSAVLAMEIWRLSVQSF